MSFNASAAAALEQIARMMELLGADSFRSGAIARAARTIENLTEDLGPIARSADARQALMAIEGIGPKIADKLIELATTGKIQELDELIAQVPPGLLNLFKIQGLGPKTIALLWRQAGVTDVEGLKKIIADGSIGQLPRMGAKTVDRLKASIAVMEEGGKRLALGPAWEVAQRVVAHLKCCPGVMEISPAGSLRRGRDTVGDIDILVATSDPKAASEAFTTMAGVQSVLASGETKSSVRLAISDASRWDGADSDAGPKATGPGVQVDLRVVPIESWGAALMYFTGSKEHNIRLRQRALDMGLTLNEYGLFPLDKHPEAPHKRGVVAKAARSEEEIYRALKLVFVPPEIREDSGELEITEPVPLVEVADIKAELHAHTTASDGALSIAELAEAAHKRGFHTIAVTDHSQSSAIAGGLKPKRLREHMEAVRTFGATHKGIRVLAGSEVDILADGKLDYDDDLLAALDVVVASPHAALTQDADAATARLVAAIEHPSVHILGHPTGRLVLRRRGLEPDMTRVIAAAKENNVALEINAHWMRLDLRATHVRAAVKAGCLIAINCDVHQAEDFDNLRFGVMTGRRGWLPPEQCINTWSADRLWKWLRSKRR